MGTHLVAFACAVTCASRQQHAHDAAAQARARTPTRATHSRVPMCTPSSTAAPTPVALVVAHVGMHARAWACHAPVRLQNAGGRIGMVYLYFRYGATYRCDGCLENKLSTR